MDAFSRSWNGKCFYAFPPLSLIQRCLDRVELDQAQGVLLVPAWPTQTWYIRLLQMLSGQPVVKLWTAQSDLLLHPSGPKMHNLQGRLSLMACPVSSNSIESKAFRNTLPMFSSAHGGQLLRNSTQSILENGLCSVVQGRLLTALLEFLYGLLRKSFSALNSARSALSSIVSVDGLKMGQHPVVCRFLKGAFSKSHLLRSYMAFGM